jgi:uncharacterized membrane protein
MIAKLSLTPTLDALEMSKLFDPKVLARLTLCALLLLIVICLATETLWAPVQPGGSLLALKVIPLALCIRGVWRSQRYVFQVLSLLVWPYFMLGIVRATSDSGLSAISGATEAMASILLFVCCAKFAHMTQSTPR